MIKEIQEAVTIPVMAKARIGHFAEAQVLQALEVDYIDESEVLTPADEAQPHRQVRLRGAVRLRRHQPRRGAAADRRGRGDDPLQGRGRHRQRRRGGPPHARDHRRHQAARVSCGPSELAAAAKELQAPLEVVREVAERGRLPVPLFCAGGIATPADAALMMQLGAEGNFVGSGIFKSADPERRARAIVEATTHFNDPERVAAASIELGEAMPRPRDRRPRRRRRACSSSRGCVVPADLHRSHRRPRHPGRLRGPRADAAPSSAPTPREVRTPGGPRGPRRPRHPRRREHDDQKGIERDGPRAGDPRPPRSRAADPRHLRRDDRLRPRAPRADRRDRRAQRLRPPAAELRGGPRGRGRRATSRCARSSSARPGSSAHGAGVEVLAAFDGHPVAVREGNVLACAFHPELTDDPRLHALFMAMATARAASAAREEASDERPEGRRTWRRSSSATRPR